MAEAAKLRLVRCPKCENVLPEFPDYSVYQCGGCGAVLRAKAKKSGDNWSEKSDEEKISGDSEKSENLLSRGRVAITSDGSETDVKSIGSSTTRVENGVVEGEGLKSDQMVSENNVNHDGKHKNVSKVLAEKWVHKSESDMSVDRTQLGDASVVPEVEELKSEPANVSETQKSGTIADPGSGVRDEVQRFRRTRRASVDSGVRFLPAEYRDEGPSNYRKASNCRYGEQVPTRDDPDGSDANRVEYLEQDRAELLRKLDELKDQLTRSCNVPDNPKENAAPNRRAVPADPYAGSGPWFEDCTAGPNRAVVQYFMPEKHVPRPSYYEQYLEPLPINNRHDSGMHTYYHPKQVSNHISEYEDPFGPQMIRRAAHHTSGLYQQPLSHQYFPRQYLETDPDPFEPYTHNTIYHQPSCSCFHCYTKHRPDPAAAPPNALGNRRFPDAPNNPMSCPYENPGTLGPPNYNSRRANPHVLNSRESKAYTRLRNDPHYDIGSFVRPRPQRFAFTSSGRHCHPIAGGAPFITCHNCFQLLQLPNKALFMEKSGQKMQCGACLTTISFAVVNKKLVVSDHAELFPPGEDVDFISSKVVQGSNLRSCGHLNRASTNSYSYDYDNSGYEFHSMDKEPMLSTSGQAVNLSKVEEMHNLHSSTSSSLEDDSSPESFGTQKEVMNPVEVTKKAILSPPPPGSPLQEHFDYSSNNYAVNRFGKGNQSSRSDHEKAVPNRVTSRQNSLKEASLATEMEVSFNEYSNTGISQDSVEISREEEKPKTNKGGESFFVAIIKKSFGDFSKSSQVDHGRSNVTVNGHRIPDRQIKKAEKQAGPIGPGQYWYDFRAGFWGIIGGPCLGIIMPFIEEFSYPLAENCAGGNTGVFVNGRELHQKDLDLLASRGLPTMRDRSYIIEISGRVLDEDTGEELAGLGKLAPTVEKVKCGFGMQVPKTSA
ncbi:putative zinc-ribbon domain, plant [Dillenia turbinata]|uniref:Zinc-ribbon domain, plant n=1 Tax=Dillenia turbinata TaxID=194707 RepID=A0AAN8UWR8_9MAGN